MINGRPLTVIPFHQTWGTQACNYTNGRYQVHYLPASRSDKYVWEISELAFWAELSKVLFYPGRNKCDISISLACYPCHLTTGAKAKYTQWFVECTKKKKKNLMPRKGRNIVACQSGGVYSDLSRSNFGKKNCLIIIGGIWLLNSTRSTLTYFSTSTLLCYPLNRHSLGSFNFFLPERT